MQLEYPINPRKIALTLAGVAVYFALQSLIVEYLIENVLDQVAHRPIILALDLFSVNAERTIPTWYATLLLFFAAVLLAFIANAKRTTGERLTRYWGGLVVVFLYLSMDEGAVIHEVVADTLQTDLNLTGYLTFGWQLVYVPLVILFGLVYLRFLFHQPPRTRNLFILAGALYVGGAVVVEGISANQYDLGGGVSFEYLAIATVEELSEMLGVIVLIYTLLDHAVERQYAFVFRPSSVIEPAPLTDDTTPSRIKFASYRPVVALAVLVAAGNVALVTWALNEPPASPDAGSASLVTQIMIDQFANEGVLITRMVGSFGVDNPAAQQVVSSLLDIYDEVMVISLGSSPSSYVLAGDDLPFDQSALTETLRANGETQFIIFDTSAAKVIAGIQAD